MAEVHRTAVGGCDPLHGLLLHDVGHRLQPCLPDRIEVALEVWVPAVELDHGAPCLGQLVAVIAEPGRKPLAVLPVLQTEHGEDAGQAGSTQRVGQRGQIMLASELPGNRHVGMGDAAVPCPPAVLGPDPGAEQRQMGVCVVESGQQPPVGGIDGDLGDRSSSV
jgi:hypothetical protein